MQVIFLIKIKYTIINGTRAKITNLFTKIKIILPIDDFIIYALVYAIAYKIS